MSEEEHKVETGDDNADGAAVQNAGNAVMADEQSDAAATFSRATTTTTTTTTTTVTTTAPPTTAATTGATGTAATPATAEAARAVAHGRQESWHSASCSAMSRTDSSITSGDASPTRYLPKDGEVAAAGKYRSTACPICLEPYTPTNPAVLYPCKHTFHFQCAEEWRGRSNTCPMCLKPMKFNRGRILKPKDMRILPASSSCELPPMDLSLRSGTGGEDDNDDDTTPLISSGLQQPDRRQRRKSSSYEATAVGSPLLTVGVGTAAARSDGVTTTGTGRSSVEAALPHEEATDACCRGASEPGREVGSRDARTAQRAPSNDSGTHSVCDSQVAASEKHTTEQSPGTAVARRSDSGNDRSGMDSEEGVVEGRSCWRRLFKCCC